MQKDDVAVSIERQVRGPGAMLHEYEITKPLKDGSQPHSQPSGFLAPAVSSGHSQSTATSGTSVPAVQSLGTKVLAPSHLKHPRNGLSGQSTLR